nr:MAG TPA: helix-turn-helix domain protein [Bacteriophage sp.]
MTQGERVKEIRKSLDLTLEKFGEKLGVTKTTISRIEKGINNLTEQMTISICREYNVNYDYLTCGDGEMFDDLPQTVIDELCAQYNLSDSEKAIIEMYVSLPEDFRQLLKERTTELLHKQGWTKAE